jgi:predicted ATPase
VSEFIGYNIEIDTTTEGQLGWVEMYLVESWGKKIKIKKRYISDGLLRIIAFSSILTSWDKEAIQENSILETNDSKGFIMLDEVEDGINPTLAEKLIGQFKYLSKELGHQVLITSHSPVMLNFVDESDILFMWRDSNGAIRAKPLFQATELKEALDFLGPGEVWLNYPKENIIEMLEKDMLEADDD